MNQQEFIKEVQQAILNVIKQGCRSTAADGSCKYRGVDNTRCLVGWLINDEDYREEIEGVGVRNKFVISALRFTPDNEQLRLLGHLQTCHDHSMVVFVNGEFVDLGFTNNFKHRIRANVRDGRIPDWCICWDRGE